MPRAVLDSQHFTIINADDTSDVNFITCLQHLQHILIRELLDGITTCKRIIFSSIIVTLWNHSVDISLFQIDGC